MKAVLKNIDNRGVKYQAIMFVCPGCKAGGPDGYDGLHMLPVNAPKELQQPSWEFDGNLDSPTLSPSILSKGGYTDRCHSFLRKGVFEFLTDSTHPLSGQSVPIPDLPEWVEEMD